MLLELTFDLPMDQTVTPDNAVWDLIIDGVSEVIELQAWTDALHLEIQTEVAVTGVDPITLELLVESEGLHTVTGVNVLPFDPVTVPED